MKKEKIKGFPKKSLVYEAGNASDILEFCKEALVKCPLCDGSGEIEDEYGLKSCLLCNSRLIRIRSIRGEIDLDYGDRVIKTPSGIDVLERDEIPF